ncbi:unnamed protein product [Calypogeia fissa]
MRFRPLSLSFVRSRRPVDRDPIEDGPSSGRGDDWTQDGTIDVHGRPASKRRTGGWKGAMFVLVEQVGANTAWYGIGSNLVIFLTTIMHESNNSAANNVNNWNGVGYIAPLIAAFIADSYCGRFIGAIIFSVIYIVGLAMLTVVGSVKSFRPPQCDNMDVTCQHASVGEDAFLYTALYVMVVGAGGVQGTIVPFGADQFDEEDDKEKLQKSSFFNWAYQTNLIGSFISCTFFVYLQENVSFGVGWGLACAFQVLGTIVVVMGVWVYRYHKPGGNPLLRIAQVVIAALRKRQLKVSNVDDLYEVQQAESVIKGSRRINHSNRFRFLDKASIMTEAEQEKGAVQNPWQLCTVTQVEEVKFVLRVIPIFLTGIIYTVCYSQLITLFVEQGYSMDRNLGSFVIPAASLGVFESISVLFWVVVWDQLLVPFLRKRTGNQRGISELQRIGIGLALSILSMVFAAIVEIERLRIVRIHGLVDNPDALVPMSVFWEVPQYFVMGASEVFTYIGLMEFFYAQAPDAIRSVGSSIALLAWAVGYFVTTLLLTIVSHITRRGGKPGWVADNLNQGRIDLFYWLLAILSFINLFFFIFCAVQYEYMVTTGPISAESEVLQQEKDGQREQSMVNESAHNPPADS